MHNNRQFMPQITSKSLLLCILFYQIRVLAYYKIRRNCLTKKSSELWFWNTSLRPSPWAEIPLEKITPILAPIRWQKLFWLNIDHVYFLPHAMSLLWPTWILDCHLVLHPYWQPWLRGCLHRQPSHSFYMLTILPHALQQLREISKGVDEPQQGGFRSWGVVDIVGVEEGDPRRIKLKVPPWWRLRLDRWWCR